MNFRKLFIIALFFPFVLPAQSPTRDGGSCSYSYSYSPAVVLYIYPKGETYTEVVFSVNTGNGADTISYSSINHMPLPNDTVKKYNIHRGDVFTFETGHMYSGSCNPNIQRFKLQKYKPDLPGGYWPNEKSCTYTKAVDEARVISVVPVDSDSAAFEIYFIVLSTTIDTISFSQVNKRFVSAADLKKHNIKCGTSLTYIEKFINSGDCQPYIREITFDAYDQNKNRQ